MGGTTAVLRGDARAVLEQVLTTLSTLQAVCDPLFARWVDVPYDRTRADWDCYLVGKLNTELPLRPHCPCTNPH